MTERPDVSTRSEPSSRGSPRSPHGCATDGLVETEETWVSAGGSAFFDLVVERLGPPADVADRLVLRAGRYVTHDAGEDEQVSPFAQHDPGRRFRSALEVWGAVLSRPEEISRSSASVDETCPSTGASLSPSRSSGAPVSTSTSRAR